MTGQSLDTLKSRFAANLDGEIRRLSLTNDAFARLIDEPERQVRRWRNGETSPRSHATLAKIATVCERDVAWFYLDHSAEAAHA